MSGAQVASVVHAAEGERENVVDGEWIAEAGGRTAEPAHPLLGQHLLAQSPVGAVIATRRRAPAPPLMGLLVHGAARPACGAAALDTGTQAAHFDGGGLQVIFGGGNRRVPGVP